MNRAMQKLSLSLAVVLLGLVTAPVQADEGRIPIFEAIEYHYIHHGDFSGRYVVTRDITVTSGSQAVIGFFGTGVETVDLDLNGFRLSHTGTPQYVIHVVNVKSFKVRNGFLSTPAAGGEDGLRVFGGSATVEDLHIDVGGSRGIWLQGCTNCIARRNVILAPEGIGIDVDSKPDSPIYSATVEDNMVTDFGSYGIQAVSYESAPFKSVTIQRNTIKAKEGSANGAGIWVLRVNGASITDNAIAGIVGYGIYAQLSSGHEITGNVVRESYHGIRLKDTSSSLVADNVLNENARDGIFLEGTSTKNVIERNMMVDNGRFGLYFYGTNDNMFGRNAARGNTGTGGTCTSGTPTCGAPNYCDQGTGNTSFGDNLLPGPPNC